MLAILPSCAPRNPPPPTVAAPAAEAVPAVLQRAQQDWQACTAPAAPVAMADGATASREQMQAAHDTVKAFDTATTHYTQCVDAAASQAGEQFKAAATAADLQRLKDEQDRRYDAALDIDKQLASRFNEQLRIYKARGGTT
jgi:hypothetical protein